MRLRLLPLVMLIACLAFAAKVSGVWLDKLPATPALAANAGESLMPETSGPAAAADSGEAAMPSDESLPATPIPAQQKASLPADPFALTDEEIELLQSLAQRREELEQQAHSMDQREAMLAAAESRIEEKINELESLRATIEALLQEHSDKQDEQIQSLVKIYESMKPQDAARIFEELDMGVLLQVIGRMKERKSAPILAKMDPGKAKSITLQLAQRRDLPIPKE